MSSTLKTIRNGNLYVTKATALDMVQEDKLVAIVQVFDFDSPNKDRTIAVSLNREEYITKRSSQRNLLSKTKGSRPRVDDFGGMF